MGGRACGPMGLAAPRAWGAPQRWSSPRAGRRMGQGPPHQHLCAGPRALSAYGMRPWQVGSGGNSAPDSQWGEALSHSAPGTRLGSDSDSAVQVPWQAPMAKDLAWDGMAPLRPWRNMKQMPAERASRCRNRRSVLSPLPSASDTVWTESLGVQAPRHWSPSGDPRQPNHSGSQGPWGKSLDKEAWAPRSSMAGTGALRWSWDKLVGKGDGGSPGAAPCQGSGSAMRPSLRRRFLGDPQDEEGRWEWKRETPARSRWGAEEHSLGAVAWAYF